MDLPIRILDRAPSEPVISVDGAFGAPGLELSHWPGNATPADLRHDLSTGAALRFAELDARRRSALAPGATAIVNNHFDTDGTCALFAVRFPEAARARSAALLEAAACGDFFRLPSERAFVVDAIVGGWVDEQRSPWRADFAGLSRCERYELAARRALPLLAEVLDGAVEDFRSLWESELEALRADRADLGRAVRDDIVHFDLTVWTAPAGLRSSRPGLASELFDPGRHALFGTSEADRQLAVGRLPQGTTYRFLIGTLSWFDLVSRRPQPRPDLARLAAELNEAEGTAPADEVAWRHQDPGGASPELWFGRAPFETFAQHAEPVLVPSALDPLRVKAALIEALRACWAFPE